MLYRSEHIQINIEQVVFTMYQQVELVMKGFSTVERIDNE